MHKFPVMVLSLSILISLTTGTPAYHQEKAGPAKGTDKVQHSAGSYILPFAEGFGSKLLQGNNGPYGHKGHVEFAYDFQMPIGSAVIAARGGEVVRVVEDHDDGTRVPGQENVLVVKHPDGTFARYYHLTKEGVLVSVGNKVIQGDKVALSGNSGASAGPHLHFDVTKDCIDWGCQTIKVEFGNVKENPLKPGEVYEPLPAKKN